MSRGEPRLTLHPDEVETIRQFAASVTVPIAYCVGGFPEPIGSGTLLAVGERLFVLSASHIFENCKDGLFYLPPARTDGPPLQIGEANLVRAKAPTNVDVAVLELRDEAVRETIRTGWRTISLANIGSASDAGLFVLSGYPSDRLRPVGKTLRCTCITAITERLIEFPTNTKEAIDPEIDLFFLYEKTGRYSDGESAMSPKLNGTSGGGVWERHEIESQGLWTSQKALKLVGIQSSAMHFEWFRAHRSFALLEAIAGIDEEMRLAVQELHSSRAL